MKSTILATVVALATAGAFAGKVDADGEDGSLPAKRAPIHHVKPSEHQREIETLKAEVSKLRAQAEMCQDIVAKKQPEGASK